MMSAAIKANISQAPQMNEHDKQAYQYAQTSPASISALSGMSLATD
jgi:hypothetical protein